MPIERSEWIYYSGDWVRWDDAKVHVTAHALHYGTSAFEGIRAYDCQGTPSIFRLDSHVRRLLDSCKMLRFDMGDYDHDRLSPSSLNDASGVALVLLSVLVLIVSIGAT